MTYYPFSFDAEIVHHDVGSERYVYTVVFLPPEILAELPLKAHPRLRITGEINDHPFDAALTPVRGAWYILFSRKMLAAIGARPGDEVQIRFRIADQDAVEIPPALQAALSADRRMSALWNSQTPGKRRGLAYRVASAKTAKTQSKRVAEVFDILEGKRDLRGKLLKAD